MRNVRNATGFAGATAAVHRASQEAGASDALSAALREFLDAVERHGKNKNIKGFLFEHIEVAKFNADAARKGLGVHARVTGSISGRGTDIVDVEVVRAGEVIKSVQMKASNDVQWLAEQASDTKYAEMEFQVPSDRAQDVGQMAERDVSGGLDAAAASSRGTTTDELAFAEAVPKSYAFAHRGSQVIREAAVTGAHAALWGAVLGGAVSLIRTSYSYARGDIETEGALRQVGRDAVTSSARSAVIAGSGSIIRNVAKMKGPASSVGGVNATTVVATGVLDVGKTVREYAKGNISAEMAAERLGQTGTETVSGLYVGAATGTVFGPVGAILGSIAGYYVAATVYQSCIDVMRDARCSEEESARVAAICFEAVALMEDQRVDFERWVAKTLQERQEVFDESFAAIDCALVQGQADRAIEGLRNLVDSCGRQLDLADFEDFDRVMRQSEGSIPL